MTHRNLFLASLIGLTLLSGCNTPPTQVVTKTETVDRLVPENLTQKLKPSPPPTREFVLSIPPYDRETLWATYSVYLLKEVNQCNLQLEGIHNQYGKPK